MVLAVQNWRGWPLMANYTMGSDLVEVEFDRLHFVVGLEIQLEKFGRSHIGEVRIGRCLGG